MDNIQGNQSPTKDNSSITNVRQATFRYLSSHPKYYFFIFLTVIIGGCFLWLGSSGTNGDLIGIAGAFFVLGPFLVYFFISDKMRGYMMEQFAKDLGYVYEKIGDLNSVQGTLFSIGHSQSIKNAISGKENSRPVKIFLYQYTIGYGKSSHTFLYTVFESTFEGNMPHMLLHKSNSFILGNSLDFSGSVQLKLEGDFSKYFSFHVEKDFEIEAYQIFDPDFMAELIDTAKELSFEFYKNKLYVYKSGFINKKSELDMLFNISNKLCLHIEPVIKKMKFQRST